MEDLHRDGEGKNLLKTDKVARADLEGMAALLVWRSVARQLHACQSCSFNFLADGLELVLLNFGSRK